MKKLLCLLLVATSLLAKDNTVSKPEADGGWVLLFDGESLFGWTQDGGAKWRVSDGLLSQAADGGYLRTNSAFSDFDLKFDYRISASDADCSVSLRAAPDSDPKDASYQLQISDNNSDWPAGSIIGHFKADAVHPALNQWHNLEANLSGDHFVVTLDNRGLVDGKDPRGKAGLIELGCSKAGKVQFRNIKLRPLGAKALFNGSDLAGWKAVGPPPPKKGMLKKLTGSGKAKEAEWSAVNGIVHAEKGKGQLETTATYDDFVLQIAIRVNSEKKEHPKSAVFFRGDPGQLFSGYEVQVMNEYKNGDRSQPVSYGTGGITNLQAARKELADDDQFFTETIAARGRHIEVWVDGYPVSDFQDTRAEGNSPQKEARTAAGTISLQAPDEKANLDFRNISLSQLPKTLGKGPAPAPVAAAPPTPPPGASSAANAPPVVQFPAPKEDPNKPKVQQLMGQALQTNDPQEQVKLYTEILLLDPENQVAFTGRQQAQQKIDEANVKKQQEEQQAQQQSLTASEKQAQGNEAKQKAEAAFLAGDFPTAQSQIATAQKLLPDDPEVQSLHGRIDSAIQSRNRLRYFSAGAGILVLLALITAFLVTRGKKDAYLEIIQGLDKGKRYNLDQEVIHIGAVAEDGGNKNEVVVRDVERMISRFHCEIHKRNGKFFLIDCGSANGTRLDGERAKPGKPMRVKSGARLDLAGTCTLRLGWEKKKNA
jgi:hypothetical protein